MKSLAREVGRENKAWGEGDSRNPRYAGSQSHEPWKGDSLQAFLQRIVNGDGRIEREYGLGRRRMDLLLLWPYPGGVQRAVIESKILRQQPEETIAKGLEQTWGYADRCGADEAPFVLFDIVSGRSWEERIYHRAETYQGRTIEIWGM